MKTVEVHGGRKIFPRRYRFERRGGDWRIGAGISNVLIAEGSGYSAQVGLRLLRDLEAHWDIHRKKRKIHKRKRNCTL